MVEEPFNTAGLTNSFDCAQGNNKTAALEEQIALSRIYDIIFKSYQS
jgi:hypothetical protein